MAAAAFQQAQEAVEAEDFQEAQETMDFQEAQETMANLESRVGGQIFISKTWPPPPSIKEM